MKRTAMDRLIEWKSDAGHKPLIILGVRQCGKTYLMRQFGSEHYVDVAYFNFEFDPGLSKVFDGELDPVSIVRRLSVIRKMPISKETLILLDEIQMCAPALTSLKYFEESGEYRNIIAAGSLLGVALSSEDDGRGYSFPVGKVEFLHMRPMNFMEFVEARHGPLFAEELCSAPLEDGIPGYLMSDVETAFREYCTVGGMPEAVSEWISTGDIDRVEKIQRDILASYSNDMLKHAPKKDVQTMRDIWESIPRQLASENKRFFFNELESSKRYKECRDAIGWLTDAGLIRKVPRVDKPMVPAVLSSEASIFKLYYCDIGLLRVKSNIPAEDMMMDSDNWSLFRGSLTENFVLNELLGVLDDRTSYCYWTNDTGHAEIDFLVNIDGYTVPIEVKSGSKFRTKSLTVYMDKYDPEYAFIISGRNTKAGRPTYLPLYLIQRIREFVHR